MNIIEAYRHQVGGHSRLIKPKDSSKVYKPLNENEYRFYEKLSALGASNAESGPLHILKKFVPHYYGVTEVCVRAQFQKVEDSAGSSSHAVLASKEKCAVSEPLDDPQQRGTKQHAQLDRPWTRKSGENGDPSGKGARDGVGGKERKCCHPLQPCVSGQQNRETPPAHRERECDATEARKETHEIVRAVGKHARPRERVGLPRNGMRVFFPETIRPGNISCSSCQKQQHVGGSQLQPLEGPEGAEGEGPGTGLCYEPQTTPPVAGRTTVRTAIPAGRSVGSRAESHGELSDGGKSLFPLPSRSVTPTSALFSEDHSCVQAEAEHKDSVQDEGNVPTLRTPRILDAVRAGGKDTLDLSCRGFFRSFPLTAEKNSPLAGSECSETRERRPSVVDRIQANDQEGKNDCGVSEYSSISLWAEGPQGLAVKPSNAACRAEKLVDGSVRPGSQSPDVSSGRGVQTSAPVDSEAGSPGAGGQGTPPTVRGHLRHIVLEDLVYGFKKPCVLDIKMGKRQRKVGASPEKEKRQLEKSMKTTSHELGFRLCGCQYYNKKTDTLCYRDKYWGRKLTKEKVPNAIRQWFWNGSTLYVELIPVLLEKLHIFYNCVAQLKHYRFWSSSLLWVYDGGLSDPEERRASLDIRMIDFANTIYLRDNPTPDEEYLFGLLNLIEGLETLLAATTPQQASRQLPPCASSLPSVSSSNSASFPAPSASPAKGVTVPLPALTQTSKLWALPVEGCKSVKQGQCGQANNLFPSQVEESRRQRRFPCRNVETPQLAVHERNDKQKTAVTLPRGGSTSRSNSSSSSSRYQPHGANTAISSFSPPAVSEADSACSSRSGVCPSDSGRKNVAAPLVAFSAATAPGPVFSASYVQPRCGAYETGCAGASPFSGSTTPLSSTSAVSRAVTGTYYPVPVSDRGGAVAVGLQSSSTGVSGEAVSALPPQAKPDVGQPWSRSVSQSGSRAAKKRRRIYAAPAVLEKRAAGVQEKPLSHAGPLTFSAVDRIPLTEWGGDTVVLKVAPAGIGVMKQLVRSGGASQGSGGRAQMPQQYHTHGFQQQLASPCHTPQRQAETRLPEADWVRGLHLFQTAQSPANQQAALSVGGAGTVGQNSTDAEKAPCSSTVFPFHKFRLGSQAVGAFGTAKQFNKRQPPSRRPGVFREDEDSVTSSSQQQNLVCWGGAPSSRADASCVSSRKLSQSKLFRRSSQAANEDPSGRPVERGEEAAQEESESSRSSVTSCVALDYREVDLLFSSKRLALARRRRKRRDIEYSRVSSGGYRCHGFCRERRRRAFSKGRVSLRSLPASTRSDISKESDSESLQRQRNPGGIHIKTLCPRHIIGEEESCQCPGSRGDKGMNTLPDTLRPVSVKGKARSNEAPGLMMRTGPPLLSELGGTSMERSGPSVSQRATPGGVDDDFALHDGSSGDAAKKAGGLDAGEGCGLADPLSPPVSIAPADRVLGGTLQVLPTKSQTRENFHHALRAAGHFRDTLSCVLSPLSQPAQSSACPVVLERTTTRDGRTGAQPITEVAPSHLSLAAGDACRRSGGRQAGPQQTCSDELSSSCSDTSRNSPRLLLRTQCGRDNKVLLRGLLEKTESERGTARVTAVTAVTGGEVNSVGKMMELEKGAESRSDSRGVRLTRVSDGESLGQAKTVRGTTAVETAVLAKQHGHETGLRDEAERSSLKGGEEGRETRRNGRGMLSNTVTEGPRTATGDFQAGIATGKGVVVFTTASPSALHTFSVRAVGMVDRNQGATAADQATETTIGSHRDRISQTGRLPSEGELEFSRSSAAGQPGPTLSHSMSGSTLSDSAPATMKTQPPLWPAVTSPACCAPTSSEYVCPPSGSLAHPRILSSYPSGSSLCATRLTAPSHCTPVSSLSSPSSTALSAMPCFLSSPCSCRLLPFSTVTTEAPLGPVFGAAQSSSSFSIKSQEGISLPPMPHPHRAPVSPAASVRPASLPFFQAGACGATSYSGSPSPLQSLQLSAVAAFQGILLKPQEAALSPGRSVPRPTHETLHKQGEVSGFAQPVFCPSANPVLSCLSSGRLAEYSLGSVAPPLSFGEAQQQPMQSERRRRSFEWVPSSSEEAGDSCAMSRQATASTHGLLPSPPSLRRALSIEFVPTALFRRSLSAPNLRRTAESRRWTSVPYSDWLGFPGGLYASLANTDRPVFMRSLYGCVSDSYMTVSSDDFGDSLDNSSSSSFSESEKDDTPKQESGREHDNSGSISSGEDLHSPQREHISTDSEFSSPFSSGDEEEASPPRASAADDAGYDAGDDVAKRAKKRRSSRLRQSCKNKRKVCNLEGQKKQEMTVFRGQVELSRKLDQPFEIASRKGVGAGGLQKGSTRFTASRANQVRCCTKKGSSSVFLLKKIGQDLQPASHFPEISAGFQQPAHAELGDLHQAGCRSLPLTHRSWHSAELGTRTDTSGLWTVPAFSSGWTDGALEGCEANKRPGRRTSVVGEAGCPLEDASDMKRDPFALHDDPWSLVTNGAESPRSFKHSLYNPARKTKDVAHSQIHGLWGTPETGSMKRGQEQLAVEAKRLQHATQPRNVTSVVACEDRVSRRSCPRRLSDQEPRRIRVDQENLQPALAEAAAHIRNDLLEEEGISQNTRQLMETRERRPALGDDLPERGRLRRGWDEGKMSSGGEARDSVTCVASSGLCSPKWSCRTSESPRPASQGLPRLGASFSSRRLDLPNIAERVCSSPATWTSPPCQRQPSSLQADILPGLRSKSSPLSEKYCHSTTNPCWQAVVDSWMPRSTLLSSSGGGFRDCPSNLASLPCQPGTPLNCPYTLCLVSSDPKIVARSECRSGVKERKGLHLESRSSATPAVSCQESEPLTQQRTPFSQSQGQVEGRAVRVTTRRDLTRREARRVFRLRERKKSKHLQALSSFPPFPRRHSVSVVQQKVFLPFRGFTACQLAESVTARLLENAQKGELSGAQSQARQTCLEFSTEPIHSSERAQETASSFTPEQDLSSGSTGAHESRDMFSGKQQVFRNQSEGYGRGLFACPQRPTRTANYCFPCQMPTPCSCGSSSRRVIVRGVVRGLPDDKSPSTASECKSCGTVTEYPDGRAAGAPGGVSTGSTRRGVYGDDLCAPLVLGSMDADAVLRLGLGLGLGMGMSRASMHAWDPSPTLFSSPSDLGFLLSPNQGEGSREFFCSSKPEMAASGSLRLTQGGGGDIAPLLEWVLRQWPRQFRDSAFDLMRQATSACRSPRNRDLVEGVSRSRVTGREGDCRRGRSSSMAIPGQHEVGRSTVGGPNAETSSVRRCLGVGRCPHVHAVLHAPGSCCERATHFAATRQAAFNPHFRPVCRECQYFGGSGVGKVCERGRLAGGGENQTGALVKRRPSDGVCPSEAVPLHAGLSRQTDGNVVPRTCGCGGHSPSAGTRSGSDVRANHYLAWAGCPDRCQLSSCGAVHFRSREGSPGPDLKVPANTPFCSDPDHSPGAAFCHPEAAPPVFSRPGLGDIQ
ncbi:inositol polyphosphate kinase [Cystoisospora suis]|uniref:Kinase n=1 Tax=Cystoisospora suis TaxID=483139 RepID=A0A2C6LCK5_9APIC|nr:inositol polyphosphate kinase [Cystoisospora suis]